MSMPRYYNRVGYVVLKEGNKVEDEFRGLNFKFSCEYTLSPGKGAKAHASVGILGLTADRVMKWASFCNGSEPKGYATLMGSKARTVSVYAGYESGFDQNPLFTLPVVGAWITSPPNMWLNISAWNTEEYNSHVYSVTMNSPLGNPRRPIPFKQICQKIADTLGARLKFDAYNENLLGGHYDVSITGTASDLLEYLNNNPNAYAELRIGEPDSETPELIVVQMDVNNAAGMKEDYKKAFSAGKPPVTISAQNGMIGLPKLTFGSKRASQVEVTTLLRTDISIGDTFYVKSDYLKYADGSYKFLANKIKHEGEFRGNLWQTTITGRDPLEQKSGKGQSVSK